MREANKKLDDMAETKATDHSQEDEPTSGCATGSHRRFRKPLTTFTSLVGSSRTSLCDSTSSGSGITTSIQNSDAATALVPLPPVASGRKVLCGDFRANGSGRNMITVRAAGRGGGSGGRGAGRGPVSADA